MCFGSICHDRQELPPETDDFGGARFVSRKGVPFPVLAYPLLSSAGVHEQTLRPGPPEPPDGSSRSLFEAVGRIEARLDALERRMAPLAAVAAVAPAALATVTDVLDARAARLGDIDARLGALERLTERATRPAMLQRLEALMDLAESAPAVVATAADIADAWAASAAQQGLELDRVAEQTPRAVRAFATHVASGGVESLFQSGMLDPRVLNLLGQVAESIIHASQTAPRPRSLFGVLGALRDPDVQRALGFLAEVGKGVGKQLGDLPGMGGQDRLPAPRT